MDTLNRIQKELKVPKNQKNAFGNYNYRSCEDILEAVKPLLGTATLVIEDEIVLIGDRFYVKATATLTENVPDNMVGPLKVSATAYAREPLEKKGMDTAQITGATSSYARKYALNGLFCIDDTKDADSTNEHEKTLPKPKVVKLTPEEAMTIAQKAIAQAKTLDDFIEVNENVRKSKNLTEKDKQELLQIIHDKIEGFDPTE